MPTMPQGVTPLGGYDTKFFHRQGFYDGYVEGKRKLRHSVGSWQYWHYEAGYHEGEAKRLAEDHNQAEKAG